MTQILVLLYSIQFYDIVLTYDDGPINESYKLVEFLSSENISATFFPTLFGSPQKEKFIEFTLINKHDVGNHTYTHKDLPKLDKKSAIGEVLRAHEIIVKYNAHIRYFRYPSGLLDKRIFNTLKSLHYTHVVYWDVFSGDIFKTTDEQMIGRVRRNITKNIKRKKYSSIVLFHDCSSGSIRRTKQLIKFMKDFNLNKNILSLSGDNVFLRFSTLHEITKSGGENDQLIVLDSINR
jgi:peptidoglycan/xylan/chitin deacetylase (PgdA/CDA1 family)